MKVINDSDDDADLQYPTAAKKFEDVSTFSYVRTFSVTAKDTAPSGVFFKEDGLKMYVIGSSSDNVHQYALSTAWDISTAVFLQSFSIAAQDTAPTGLAFKVDGSVMYIIGTGNDRVWSYTLGTAWDISTSVLGASYIASGEDTSPQDVKFSPDGLRMYIVGDTNNKVFMYDLSSAWTVSSATLNYSYDVSGQSTTPTGLFFSADGRKMYLSGDSGDEINIYKLIQPWNIATAVFTGQVLSTTSQDGNPEGLFISPDGTKMYVVGSANDSVYQYDITPSFKWYVLANGAIFVSASDTPASFTQHNPTTPLTDIDHISSDLAIHEDELWATSATGLNHSFGGSWTLLDPGNAFLTENIPHPMDTFNRLLFVANGNLVHQVDRNRVLRVSRLVLPSIYQIRCIQHTPSRVWFGLKNMSNGKAAVAEWDGFSDTYLYIHEVEGTVVLSMTVKGNIAFPITDAGILFEYTGSGFAPAGYLPIFSEDIYQDSPSSRSAARWKDGFTDQFMVSANGMDVIDDKVHVLLSGAIAGDPTKVLENMPSGVWCHDPDIGFYHRYSVGKFKTADTIKDYGTAVIDRPGFLVRLPTDDGGLFVGATIHTNGSGTLLHTLASKDTAEAFTTIKRGHFISTQITTENVQDAWEKMWLKFRQFRAITTKMVLKVRSSEDEDYDFPFKALITWTSGSIFTSTDVNFANVVSGEEVFVMVGDGAGALVHVLSISSLGGTYTVILDESVGTVTAASTAKVRLTNWRKVKEFATLAITKDDFGLGGVGRNETSPNIQFKLELRGLKDDPEVQELIVSALPNIEE